MLYQRTMPLRGMLPETIGKHKAQRSFCSEAFLPKKMKNAFTQNKLLVLIKTIVFCGAIGEHINSNLPGKLRSCPRGSELTGVSSGARLEPPSLQG